LARRVRLNRVDRLLPRGDALESGGESEVSGVSARAARIGFRSM
jgi:hypothetical protein